MKSKSLLDVKNIYVVLKYNVNDGETGDITSAVSHMLLKVHYLTNAKLFSTPLLNLSSFCLFVSHYAMLSLNNFLPYCV